MSEFAQIILKLLLATLFGGALGYDRERRRMPAGFRTYMLVCLGSTLVMMTNQYVAEIYGGVDVTRMGAQVISGIGFLGAGTIIVTRNNRVHGLTTAAGLWTAACIGLAIGVGYYAAAIVCGILVVFDLVVVQSLQEKFRVSRRIIDIYIECEKIEDIQNLFSFLREQNIKVLNFQLSDKTKLN